MPGGKDAGEKNRGVTEGKGSGRLRGNTAKAAGQGNTSQQGGMSVDKQQANTGGSPGKLPSDTLVLRGVGATVALAGAVMLAGWAAQIAWVVGVIPHDPTMKANTSLGFVLSGCAMLLHTLRGRLARPAARLALGCSALAAALAVLTLLEYLLDIDLRIDQFLAADRITPAQSFPGRMGINSAICLLLSAFCVWLLGWAGTGRTYSAAVAWLGALISAIALTALAAHFQVRGEGYNWLNMISMAVHTAVLYVLQGVAFVWTASKRAGFRWAIGRALTFEFAGGLLLLVAVATMAHWGATQFDQVAAEIRRSNEVLERIWALRSGIDALDSAASAYLLSGKADPGQLWAQAGTAALTTLHSKLALSAAGSPEQAERLRQLQEALGHWVEFQRSAMALRDPKGLEAAHRQLTTPEAQQRRALVYRLLSDMVASETLRVSSSRHQLHRRLERTFGLLPPGALLGMLVLSYGMVRLSIEMDTRERTAQALKLSEARQRLAVEAAGIGDWELNLATHTTAHSLRHDQIFGYSQPLAEWSYETFLEHVHPEDRARVDQLYQQSLRQAGEWAVECRIRRLDGTTGWIWLRGRCFANQAGKVESVRGVIGDITERRAAEEEIRTLNASLEQRVRDRTEKLELAIKELDAFTYSVSHDLRAPLRAIDGFSRMVIEDYSGQLQGEAQRKLAVIRSEAQRMSRLIDDLLSFSRLGRAQVHPEFIDMQALVNEIFAELQELASNHRKIQFKVHPLPPALGTQAMVRQVWTNLLSNALKFTRGREVTQIEIGSSSDPEGNTVYYIKDNGVGFDMRHVGKLFGVFQRLHSDKEFEGTGVGLALVQRIVTRHGGRVWAEAQQDKGATFFFTLPNSNV
jgi:PAS domain S-box-containing protein